MTGVPSESSNGGNYGAVMQEEDEEHRRSFIISPSAVDGLANLPPSRYGERQRTWARMLLIGVGVTCYYMNQTFRQASPILRADEPGSQNDDLVINQQLWGASNNGKFIPDPPTAFQRCDWILKKLKGRDGDMDAFATSEELHEKHVAQSKDVNVFYRATADIFWNDYVLGGWGDSLRLLLEEEEQGFGLWLTVDTKQINHKATWTWITGDQHLSNFGAWRNRHGVVVFGVNDFDEAAIYDFNVDVLRIAVSMVNHAYTNGISKKKIKRILNVFTKSYVNTVLGYMGNEDALLFELTAKTTYGKLKSFLKDVEEDKSSRKQLKKFTTVDANGNRHFIKGDIDVPSPKTSLASAPSGVVEAIRAAFTSQRYGATMMKLGWAVPPWDDDFFAVLDVAERIGSGIGSFGVDRYYVLLQGTDGLLNANDEEGGAIILDVKNEPSGSVSYVQSSNDLAWYNVLFQNEAARVVEAQRRLTSYVDPFLGWIVLEDYETNQTKPFYVRQRSPWKDGPDLSELLSDPQDFEDFMAQIAISTATSHVRGNVAKPPGDFKQAISGLLGHAKTFEPWQKAVRQLAFGYREQVLLDFECFQTYVQRNRTNEHD